MKLSKAIEDFSNWRSFKVTGHTVVRYESALRIFCLALGDPQIEQIAPNHVLSYLKKMEELGWKRNGITIVCLALRTFFAYMEMTGVKCMRGDVIPLPRKQYNIPRVATDGDFKKLVKSIPKDNHPNNIRNLALLHMIWDTWARQGEIISLNVSDIKFDKDGSGSAVIKTEKSRGRRPIREIFWTANTSKYLKKWLKCKAHLETLFRFNDSEAIFVSIQKTAHYNTRGSRMTNRGVCEVFRMLSNRAGLPHVFNAHSARHYGGRKIIEEGGASADVTNILGHSHPESSYIYTMMWGKDLKRRYNHFKSKIR